MKRCPHDHPVLPTLILMLSISGMGGCALWNSPSDAIIRVQARIDPEKAKRLTLAGVKALNSQNVDVATQKFIAAIQADESYGPAHNNLGLLHFEQGNLYQAVLAFEQAMEYMPYDAAVFYNLALTLERAGKVDQAKDLYYQAVQMDPVNPVFLGNLVRLKYRLRETGVELHEKLEDLVLIETRADWREWADDLLAMEFNDTFDRGPETPDFDPGGDEDREPTDFDIEERIIDLTPSTPIRFESTTEAPMQYHLGNQEPVLQPPQMIPGPPPSLQPPQIRSPRLSNPTRPAPSAPPTTSIPMTPAMPEFESVPEPARRRSLPREPSTQILQTQKPPSSRRTAPRQSIQDSAPIEFSAPRMPAPSMPVPSMSAPSLNGSSSPRSPDVMTTDEADDLFDSF